MNDLIQLQKFQIEALQKENERLNNELRRIKELAFKIRLSDPNFDKPLSEMDVDYELIKKV